MTLPGRSNAERGHIITITVEHINDGRTGPSGAPMAKGWWFTLFDGVHRVRGVAQTERLAWGIAAEELLRRTR